MNNVIDFPKDIDYKVLFNLPKGKVIQLRKSPEDDFSLEISGNHGTAILKASGKSSATDKVQKVFPSCEIVEVNQM